jgi:hypothetical protein
VAREVDEVDRVWEALHEHPSNVQRRVGSRRGTEVWGKASQSLDRFVDRREEALAELGAVIAVPRGGVVQLGSSRSREANGSRHRE